MTHWQHRENFTYAYLCKQHVDPDWQWVIACWSQIIGSCHEIEKLEQHHAWPSRSVDLPGRVSPAAPGGYSIRFTRQLKNMCHLSLNIRITVVTEVSFLASCRDLGTAWMQLAWHACTTPSGNKDWDGYSRNDACILSQNCLSVHRGIWNKQVGEMISHACDATQLLQFFGSRSVAGIKSSVKIFAQAKTWKLHESDRFVLDHGGVLLHEVERLPSK